MCYSSRTNCTNACATNKCVDGFCSDTAQADCQTDCSKIAIAKRALFAVLDNDNSGTIDANDATSLGVRFGYMRYYNCSSDESSINYTSGCNTLIDVISTITGGVSSTNQTSYQLIYCGDSTSCASTVTGCTTGNCIAGESATGGTPLASALKEAKLYLDTHKAGDIYKACRQKFVILVTDGSDTYACSGNGAECQSGMYKRRRESVAAAKQLADAGYKVFVVGFGTSMPMYAQNTLNWMAWYGGTDNPNQSDSGSKTAYNIPLGCQATPAVTSACCNLSTNATACFPSGITSGQTDSSTITNSDCGSSQSSFEATYNDPGYSNLSGYAFMANDMNSLTAALKSAIDTIKDATYSFTQGYIQAQRTTDEDYLYEASFEPLNNDPFWIGHLKRYLINPDGSIAATSDWDAGTVLQGVNDNGTSPRNIYMTNGTSSALQAFTAANLTNAMLGVSTDAKRTSLVNFIRKGELDSKYQFYGWKLGDMLHCSPISIPTPNSNFYDQVDQSSPPAFSTFLSSHIRTSAIGNRIILVGANDGQLHAFSTNNGSEVWSFIPPNLLPRLSYVAHSSHPVALTHTYFVDGPLSIADIWLGSGGTIGSTSKSASDWYTYAVMSEGRGGISTLWSSSASCSCSNTATDCSTVFSGSYSTTYPYYCGFYALDVTNTSSVPTFQWHLGGNTNPLSASDAAYLGQAWSNMFIGRVRINNTEKWVGLLGGGYSGSSCGTTSCSDTRGKGFYVVDLSDGTILWRYTYANNSSMGYNLVAGPVGVDSDSDGFMDTAYIGDLGGNVWRFQFCLKSDGASCNKSNWKGSLLFQSPSNTLNIYTGASVSTDTSQNLWVYFGTGNKTDPLNTTVQDRVYAVKDTGIVPITKTGTSTTYSISNLTNITSGTYDINSTNNGWYIILGGTGEKLFAAPVVFNQNVYFTTYTPTNNPCDQNGYANLYEVNYLSGAGAISGARSTPAGEGTPSGAVISINPYTGQYGVYVSSSAPHSGSTSDKSSTTEIGGDQSNSRNKNMIYWYDNRLQ
jgi:Tfp pilus tip-associated adhesin PilY1